MLSQKSVSWRPHLGQAASPATPAPAPVAPPPPAPSLPTELVMFGSGAGVGALAGALLGALAPKVSHPKWIGIGILSIGGLVGILSMVPGIGVSDTVRERAAFVGGGAAAYGAVKLGLSARKS